MSEYDHDQWHQAFQDAGSNAYNVDSNVYLRCVSPCLLFYDYFLTLRDEVRIVYHTRWTVATILYVIIRYSALLSAAATLFLNVRITKTSGPNLSVSDCRSLLLVNVASQFAAANMISAFVALRIGALYSRSKILVISLFIMGLATPSSLEHPFSIANFVPLVSSTYTIAFELVCWVLTVIKTWDTYRQGRALGIHTPLSTLLLRDGSIYFIMVVILSAVEITSSLVDKFPDAISAGLSQAFVPIFTTRFISRLRQADSTNRDAAATDTSQLNAHTTSLQDRVFAAVGRTFDIRNDPAGTDDLFENEEDLPPAATASR